MNVGETHYPFALPDEPPDQWPRISGVHGVFKHLDDHVVGGKLLAKRDKFFNTAQLKMLRARQVDAVKYLDRVVEELFDIVPKNTWITITADHGELFGEDGYFGHGPINHEKVFEVPFRRGQASMKALRRSSCSSEIAALVVIAAAAWLQAHSSHSAVNLAYVGPGAGFAFLGSFLTMLIGLFLGLVSLLLWPFRVVWRLVRRKQGYKRADQESDFPGPRRPRSHADRKVHGRGQAAESSPAEGRVDFAGSAPHFRRSRRWPGRRSQPASIRRGTTCSTSQSQSEVLHAGALLDAREQPAANSENRTIPDPLEPPSRRDAPQEPPFWHILGEHHIASTILRVPITFPPEKFNGRLLSAMCTPDLLGTQGTFALFTSRAGEVRGDKLHAGDPPMESGNQFPLARDGARLTGEIEGPQNSLSEEGGSLSFRLH